jgi:exonuclease SbcC
MIQELRLKNFQSHKDSVLEFSDGMNVIVGQSDSGKTAIIRALRWAATNRPSGEEYRSYWGGDTEVQIVTTENTITRSKTNRSNTYRLDDLEFKAFGQDVPVEIVDALNLSDVNLQQQMDNPFLLSETSGAVASHFNKMAKLDKIDTGLSYVNSSINTIKRKMETSADVITSKTEQLEKFAILEEFEIELELLESLESKLGSSITMSKGLLTTINRLDMIDTVKARYLKITAYEQEVDSLLLVIANKAKVSTDYSNLKKLSLDIFYIQRDVKLIEKVIAYKEDVESLIELRSSLTAKQKFSRDVAAIVKYIGNNIQAQENTRKRFEDLEKEFHEEFPEFCPLCNTKIK